MAALGWLLNLDFAASNQFISIADPLPRSIGTLISTANDVLENIFIRRRKKRTILIRTKKYEKIGTEWKLGSMTDFHGFLRVKTVKNTSLVNSFNIKNYQRYYPVDMNKRYQNKLKGIQERIS